MPSPGSQRTLNLLRAHRRFFQKASHEVLEMVKLTDEAVAGLNVFGTKGRLIPGLSVPTLLVLPRRIATRDAVLLHLHGGAYISGNLLQSRMVISPIASAAGLQGVTFAYRLSPEHPYPAQLEDALEVYRMLLRQGARPERIGLVGESAGGNLALALTLRLREMGERLPGALCLLSPWTDLQQTGESYRTLREADPTLDADELMEAALGFVGGDRDKLSCPMVSPIHARFDGFPATQIHVGESELLLSDSETLAEAMRRDGAPVSLLRWAGMPHVFQIYGFEESRASIRAMADFLRATLVPSRAGRARPTVSARPKGEAPRP